MTTLIFLRHAETHKDPNISAIDWTLSTYGYKQAQDVAELSPMHQTIAIYTSTESKSIETAKPLAKKLNRQIIQNKAFNEVLRGETFLSKEDFEQEKTKQLQDLNYHAFNGESGFEALERFKNGIEEIILHHPNDTVLIVSHGTILNIYFSYLRGTYQDLPERWQETQFCAYGVVKDGMIVKDIIT